MQHLLLANTDDPYAWIGWALWGSVVVAGLCFAVAWHILSKPPAPESGKSALPLWVRIYLALLISAVFTLGLCLSLLA